MTRSPVSPLVVVVFSVIAFVGAYLAVAAFTREEPADNRASGVSAQQVAERQRYVQQVTTLCSGYSPAARKGAATSPRAAAAAVQASYKDQRKLLASIEAVPPPAADRDEVTTKFITPIKGRLDRAEPLLKKLDKATKADNDAQVATVVAELVQAGTPGGTELDFARGYGLAACVG